MTTNDPLVLETRAARDKHAARFGYDLNRIFGDIKARQKASGRTYVTFPHAAQPQRPQPQLNSFESGRPEQPPSWDRRAQHACT